MTRNRARSTSGTATHERIFCRQQNVGGFATKNRLVCDGLYSILFHKLLNDEVLSYALKEGPVTHAITAAKRIEGQSRTE